MPEQTDSGTTGCMETRNLSNMSCQTDRQNQKTPTRVHPENSHVPNRCRSGLGPVSDSPPSPHTKEEDVLVPADNYVDSNTADPLPEFTGHTGKDLDNRTLPLPAQADESEMREQTDRGHDLLL